MQKLIYLFLGGLILLLTACTGESSKNSSAQEAATWTLEEDLRIDENEDYYLGRVGDVAVRSDGVMLVADPEEHHVKVISPKGELVQTVGQKGEGPGEFQGPHQVELARGDSLFVMDARWRLSVLAPESYALERAFQISTEGNHFPMEIRVAPEAGYLITYMRPGSGEPEGNLYYVNEDGSQRGRVEIPQKGKEQMMIEAKSESGGPAFVVVDTLYNPVARGGWTGGAPVPRNFG